MDNANVLFQAFHYVFVPISGAVMWLIVKAVNGARDILDLKHDNKNLRQLVHTLEASGQNNRERIVVLEERSKTIVQALERIENQQRERFDELAESIREIRHVTPKR